jgi:TRAP-type transport system periplasmic protein
MYRATLKGKLMFLVILASVSVTLNISPSYAKEVKLRLAHHFALKDVWSIAGEEFAKLVEQKSKGEIAIRMFGGGQLGAERDYLEGLQLGTIDMAISGPGVMANFDPLIGIFDLPFLYKNYDLANRVMDGPVGAKVFESFGKNARIKILASAGQGFRFVLTKKAVINSMEDIKGVKIRTPEAPTFVRTFQLIGANPTPVAWPETYSALEAGVVDGMEGTPEVMVGAKMYELAKNCARTRHIMATLQLIMSMKTWNSLDANQQNIISEAANEIWIKKQRITAEQGNVDAEKKLTAFGVKFTDPNLEPFRKAVYPFWSEWGKKYNSMDLVDQVAAMK